MNNIITINMVTLPIVASVGLCAFSFDVLFLWCMLQSFSSSCAPHFWSVRHNHSLSRSPLISEVSAAIILLFVCPHFCGVWRNHSPVRVTLISVMPPSFLWCPPQSFSYSCAPHFACMWIKFFECWEEAGLGGGETLFTCVVYTELITECKQRQPCIRLACVNTTFDKHSCHINCCPE